MDCRHLPTPCASLPALTQPCLEVVRSSHGPDEGLGSAKTERELQRLGRISTPLCQVCGTCPAGAGAAVGSRQRWLLQKHALHHTRSR